MTSTPASVKITLFGCGRWGSRVARKLAKIPGVRLVVVDEDQERARRLGESLGCAYSGDPFGYLGVTGTQASSVDAGLVVIATPPVVRERLVDAVLGGYGLAPRAIRVEKPLALDTKIATRIAAKCDEHGVALSVGFTLLHDPLYGAAFAYLRAGKRRVLRVEAVRIGAAPEHPVDPMIDAGIHAASVAAYLDAPASIIAEYDANARIRKTYLHLADGVVVVDELDRRVDTPHGTMIVAPGGDALEDELEAWIGGTHRGTPRVAVQAQRIIETTKLVVA